MNLFLILLLALTLSALVAWVRNDNFTAHH